jgi:hypothetical protein
MCTSGALTSGYSVRGESDELPEILVSAVRGVMPVLPAVDPSAEPGEIAVPARTQAPTR